MAKAIAQGFHSVTPMIVFKDVRKAIEFYKRALGAVERFVMPGPDDKGVMHAEILIGNSIIMMSEENPQNPCKSAETAGGSPVNFYIYTEAVDEAFKKAVEAGAEVKMPVQDMFWGDRVATFKDPEGYTWMFATNVADFDPSKMPK